MELSAEGLALIASFEGFAPRPYNDPAGNCTVGYGELLHVGPCDGHASEFVHGYPLTAERALDLLRAHAATYGSRVEQFTTRQLTQHQYDALTSFCYNIGASGYRMSTVRAHLNAGHTQAAADALLHYTYGNDGIEYPGLRRRRAAERALFLTEDDMTTPTNIAWVTAGQYGRDETFLAYVDASGRLRKKHIVDGAEEDALRAAGLIGQPPPTKLTAAQLAHFT